MINQFTLKNCKSMECFYFLQNFDKLGKAFISFNSRFDNCLILRPAFKEEKIDEDVKYFTPGYIDKDEFFFNCPLSIFYVQIYKVIQIKNPREYSTALEIELRMFSKDLSKQRKLNIKFNTMHFDMLNKIVNWTNLFIESNRDIDLIDFSAFSFRSLNLNDKSIILEAVDRLKFEFFDNSSYRAGKDNYFWLEAEIRNLPTDKYLNKLIFENLAKQCEGIIREDDGIFMRYKSESSWSPSFNRIKSEKSDTLEKDAKDLLKLDMAIEYNSTEQLLEQLTKN